MSPEPFDARYWREAYEALVKQTGRDLNDGYGVDPRKADPAPFHLDALQVATAKLSEVMEENARLREGQTLAPDGKTWRELALQQAEQRGAAEARVKELEEFAAFVLSADRESLANHGPKWGLADAVDNDGKPYQSQSFGDQLSRVRSLLSREG